MHLAKRVSNGNNIWDKKHICKYCRKQITKVSSQLQRMHENESEVCNMLALPKSSVARQKASGQLSNAGDYEHNYNLLSSGSGTLIPKYRSKSSQVDSDS